MPSGWIANGNTDQQVTGETAAEGDKSFRISGSAGGCWRALANHECDLPESGTVVFTGSYRPTSTGAKGCHNGRGGLQLRTGADSWSDGKSTRLFGTTMDGSFIDAAGNETGSYTVDAWNSFTITYERSDGTVTLSYQFNGEDAGEVSRDATSFEDELQYLTVTSDDFTVCWDALRVTKGTGSESGGGSNGGGSGGDGDAGGTIAIGETVEGTITEDDPLDPRFDYYHTEPWTVEASAGDRLTITVSDGYPLVRGPGVDTVSYQTVTTTVQTDGTYKVYPIILGESPKEYTLTLSGSSSDDDPSYHRLRTVDHSESPISGAEVRLLHIPDSLTDPAAENVEMVARARSDEDGYAVFDGTSGRALPVADLSRIRSDYDGSIVVAGRTPDESNPWFGAIGRSPSEFLSSQWVDGSLPLHNQLLFGPSNGPGENGTATVWRSLARGGDRQQDLFVSVSHPHRTAAGSMVADDYEMKSIGAGMAAFRVPEDVIVDYDFRQLETTGVTAKRAGSLALSDAYPGLPPYPPLWETAYTEYRESEIGREALQGVIGQLPVVGTLTGFAGTMSEIFDIGEGIKYTIGPGTETNPNEHDVVSAAWKGGLFNYVYRVPIEFPDATERTFAARALWEGGSFFDGKIHLDTPFTIGPVS